MAKRRPFENIEDEYTKIHNFVLDVCMHQLSHTAWKVLCVAMRKTLGYVSKTTPSGRKEWDRISFSQFRDMSGIRSNATISRAIQELLDAGYMLRFEDGRHPGTGKPTYKYGLNQEYEIEWPVRASTDSVLADADPEIASSKNELGASSKNELGASSKFEHTKEKETKQRKGMDGLQLLLDFEVNASIAHELADCCTIQRIGAWIRWIDSADGKGITDPPAFLVSKLRTGEWPPQAKRKKGQDADRRDRYTGGEYGHLVES